MIELSPLVQNVVIACVALVLYLITWRITADLPGAARVLARLALAVVIVVPVLIAVLADGRLFENEPSSPKIAQAPPAKRAVDQPRSVGGSPPAPGDRTAMAERSAPPPQPAPVPQPVPQAGPVTPQSAPPPAVSAPAPAAGDTPGSTRGDGAALPPGVADVVPVFYGTDRGRDPRIDRLGYTAERAKRLEIGRAMVSIPKDHQVPQVERPWTYKIPFTNIVLWQEGEDPAKHFIMRELNSLSKEAFLSLVRERLNSSQRFRKQALIFIHGFNTTFDHAIYRTAQIAYDLKFDGAPFTYSWPSRGAITLVDYNYDRESAGQAEPHLKAFLEMVAKETGAASVNVIAHSMGNQALLPVLRQLRQAAPEGMVISQLIFAAPDVDRDNFEFLAREIAGISRGSTLFVAANDRALEASKRLAGGPRAGDVPPGGPIVLPGIDTIDVTKISSSIFSLNHSGYAESTALISDMQILLETGTRPPAARVPTLQAIQSAAGRYWRYP